MNWIRVWSSLEWCRIELTFLQLPHTLVPSLKQPLSGGPQSLVCPCNDSDILISASQPGPPRVKLPARELTLSQTKGLNLESHTLRTLSLGPRGSWIDVAVALRLELVRARTRTSRSSLHCIRVVHEPVLGSYYARTSSYTNWTASRAAIRARLHTSSYELVLVCKFEQLE